MSYLFFLQKWLIISTTLNPARRQLLRIQTNMKNYKKLTPADFKRIQIENTNLGYLSHTLPAGEEVCLESCLNGFDVAVYNKNKNLIGEKTCTNLNPINIILALNKALEIANQKIKDL